MYSIRQAQKVLSQLVRDAARGKQVIITFRGAPFAKLVPIQQPRQRKPGTLKGKLKILPGAFDPLTAEELLEMGFE